MKYLSPEYVYIIYRILRGIRGLENKATILGDFNSATSINLIAEFIFTNLRNKGLEIKTLRFQDADIKEEPDLNFYFNDAINTYAEKTLNGFGINEYYTNTQDLFNEKWFKEEIEDVKKIVHDIKKENILGWYKKYSHTHNKNTLSTDVFFIALNFITFNINTKKNLILLNNLLEEYIIKYINGELELININYYTFAKSKAILFEKFKKEHENYGKEFIVDDHSFLHYSKNLRVFDTILSLEFLDYIEIKRIKITKNSFSYYLKLKDKFIEETKENTQANTIKEIYILKGQSKYSIMVIGNNSGAIIEPKESINKNSWATKLYQIGKDGFCEFSRSIEAVNNNSKLELYKGSTFNLTKILRKEGGIMKPEEGITIKTISQDAFAKKRAKI